MAQSSDLILLPTGYSLDDLEPQIGVAYELEAAGIAPEKIKLVFCRAKGSDTEDADARSYIKRARLTVLEPVMPEMASIRQAHAEGLAASEVPFPSLRERSQAVARAISEELAAFMKEGANG